MSLDEALNHAQTAIRNAEREVTFGASSYDAARAEKKRAAARSALAALEAAQADHQALADLRERLAAAEAKGDELVVDTARQDLDALMRAADRDRNADPITAARKQTEWVEKVRAKIDEHRGGLGGAAGRKLIEDMDGWFEAMEAKIAGLTLRAEAFALFHEAAGGMTISPALESAENGLDRDDPERVVQAWDAAKKLAPRFRDPRFQDVPEVKAVVEKLAELEARIAAELAPKLAKVRMAPLLRSAEGMLDNLKQDTDNLDEAGVLRWRKELRRKLAAIVGEGGDQPDAQDFLALCERAFRRSEEELGDQIVIREIEEVEAVVKPRVERLERSLLRKAASAVRDHATRLRATVGALEPFSSVQRAQVLRDRAQAALARVEAEMGAEMAQAIARAEEVPRIDIDVAWDSRVQEILTEVNRHLAMYRKERGQAQEGFDESVDLEQGTIAAPTLQTIERAARRMATAARTAGELGDRVEKIDRAHPTVTLIAAAAPKLVERAQAWKALLTRKCAYAEKIHDARAAFDGVEIVRKSALGSPLDAISHGGWSSVVEHATHMAAAAAEAADILPDDHDEADAWGAKAAAVRQEAIAKMGALCLAEATRLAVAGRHGDARRYAEALKHLVPDAPEVAQIEAIIAGTADARLKAENEVRTRAILLASRLEASAKAARAAYDAWAADQKPIVALAGRIVANLDAYRGKWVAGFSSSLGDSLSDEPCELRGDVYQVEYDPAVREALAAGMQKVRDLYRQMVEAVMRKYDVPGLGTSSGFYPDDTDFLCEVVGVQSYTPRHEVRDSTGRVLGTVSGNPYPVPRVVLRAAASTYYVIVPGQPSSVDQLDTDGIV